jgi:signal recognition particle subunit SRP54
MTQDLSNAQIDEKKIVHIIAIINSMTRKEKGKPKIINGRRRMRISKGSGRPVQEINQLLKQFFEMQKYMKKPFFRKMLKKFDFFNKMM